MRTLKEIIIYIANKEHERVYHNIVTVLKQILHCFLEQHG
jgi:hypothetical protein